MIGSSRPLRTRLAAIAAGAAVLAAVGVSATAGPAAADTVINIHYPFTGTTYIAKLKTTVNLGSGTLAASVDLTTGASSGTLTLPPQTISVKELGIIPVTATSEMIQNGPATGTANLSTNTISSTASVTLKLDSLNVAGLNLPIGNHCETTPFDISISSGTGFTISGGGPVNGTYTIPAFRHCGLNTPLINLTIPGSGNTINLVFGPLQIG
jgi:hypothetical protein